MSVDIEFVEKDYNKLKKLAKFHIQKKNYEDAINLISCAANIAYHLNFKFYDDELELYLERISTIIIKKSNFEPIKGRWVFYDYFGLDNRGLTQQYLNALEDLGVEFLYILEKYSNEKNHKDILNQLKNNSKVVIYINDNSLNYKAQLQNITKVLDEYKPERALLHLAPWSCLSIILWNNYYNVIERYFINITDHAFWLGKNTFDYCIEFREYGMYFSNKFRNIEKSKLLLSHFYPIVHEKEFLGFPDDIQNKLKIFSGGSYYKVYGANGLYFNIVKQILDKYENTVLLFAGSGDDRPLKEFIKNNKLENRIFLLGHRTDINEVIKNSDIYLNTYPLGGGLLNQYALLNNVPVIAYAEKELPMIFTETMTYKGEIKCTYTDIQSFNEAFDSLIHSNKKTTIDVALVSPSKKEFLMNFKKILYNKKKPIYEIKDFNFIKERFRELYFDTENNYLKQYHLIKFKWLKLKYFKYDFFHACISVLNILYNHRTALIKKISKKVKFKK